MIKARIAIAQRGWKPQAQKCRILCSIILAISGNVAAGWVSRLTAQAQVQRHPKIMEARSAIADILPNALPNILQRPTYREDGRSQEDIEAIQSFVTDWAIVSPNTALFLGEWTSASSNGSTATWSIYPSYKAGGRVCVLRQRYQPDIDKTDYLFGVGHLVTPSTEAIIDVTDFIYQLNVTGAGFSTSFQRVTTSDIETFITNSDTANTDLAWQSGTVLAEVTVNPVNDDFFVGALSAFPRPLTEPDFGPPRTAQDNMGFIYAAAGCTTDRPQTREWGIELLELGETQELSETPGVGFQFNGAYIPVSETGNSVEVYWTVSNQSDRNIAIQPLNIRVETEDEVPIDCPEATDRFRDLVGADEAAGCARGYLDPWQDGFLEPGSSVSGRVVILRRPDELEGTFLVVPDSMTGGLEAFRIPIR
ncbi:MAG: hypothetical protein AAGD25_14530 [Cyanobacteria bacterium P01_F01_bin.150]